MSFLKFSFSSDMLILGERFKKGQYRPVITTIPYSQIIGALQARYGNDRYNEEAKQIHACGHFLFTNETEFMEKHIKTLTYSPRNRYLNSSILPIYTEYLHNVVGSVYLKANDDVKEIIEDARKGDISLWMGGLKSKGFGKCKLTFEELINGSREISEGQLNTRLPVLKLAVPDFDAGEEEIKKLIEEGIPTNFLKEVFGIKSVKTANFGYLFEPTTETDGKYVLSLFEGSVIEAQKFLLKKNVRNESMNTQTDDTEAEVIEGIQKNRKVGGYLSNKFLNTVGDIFEKKGMTTTKTFLWEKRSRRDQKYQAEALLEVLKILEKHPSIGRNTGRFIIKSINAIKSKEVKEND